MDLAVLAYAHYVSCLSTNNLDRLRKTPRLYTGTLLDRDHTPHWGMI